MIFSLDCPLGRFSLKVAMSVCLCLVCRQKIKYCKNANVTSLQISAERKCWLNATVAKMKMMPKLNCCQNSNVAKCKYHRNKMLSKHRCHNDRPVCCGHIVGCSCHFLCTDLMFCFATQITHSLYPCL